MKNLIGAFLFTISLAVSSYCQLSGQLVSTGNVQPNGDKPRIAVLEFTVESDTSGVDANGPQMLQEGVVTELKKVAKIDAFPIKQSHSAAVRELYQQYLGRRIDPAAAVKIGKLLGVNFVMTGHVKVFNGICQTQTQIVGVATGKVEWTAEASRPCSTLTGSGSPEIDAAAVRAITKELTPTLAMAELLRKTLENAK